MPMSLATPEVQRIFNQAAMPSTKSVTVDGRLIEVPTPFLSPADWRDHWIYFLLVDRFNNPQVPPRLLPFDGSHGVFQGGTFDGVRRQLDYLKQLGVGAIWLSPVLKNCQYNPFSYHGYGIQDFLQVDPRFATDPQSADVELQTLIDEAHARGLYVIFDIVLNHTGDVFEYVFDNGDHGAEADWRNTPYSVAWRDESGRGRSEWSAPPDDVALDATVWPSELRRNEFFRREGRGGEAGGDFASLKELVTDYQRVDASQGRHYPVRNVLIRAYQYLIAKFDIDGFRIDTLKYIEPDFARAFGNAMREYALGIGKKNFFTFGEVYDNDEQIARFIGRNASDTSEPIGVDAALDFPLFFKLPAMAKGLLPPSELVALFEHRKQIERGILSSHGEASRYFVTFLDNHDQRNRFYFSPADAPRRYDDQLTLALACLFTLQGIPCLYYGTEQGLHGTGDSDLAVREAFWGKPDAFNRQQPFYRTIKQLSDLRQRLPALRYGRQYFRSLSGDQTHFGLSSFAAGVLAFSRILNDQEVLVVANLNTTSAWDGEVVVDFALNVGDTFFEVQFSNKPDAGQSHLPPQVIRREENRVEVREVNDTVTRGPIRVLPVVLAPMELQILSRQA
ncbi:MAG: alpha-amylase [Gammaproteobacteria bacterium]|nr:alpha-amylase [Gammaproteobacteria bacterium]